MSNNSRQPMAVVAVGQQGGGKTYTTTKEMELYKKKFKRPVLIVDVNNEYSQYKSIYYDANLPEQKKRVNGHPKKNRMGLAQIREPRTYRIIGIRPDGRSMSNEQLVQLILDICDYYVNGALILEEMNTYIRRNVPASFYGFMIRLRHKGIDLIMHYQSINDAHPDIWAQTKALRMHKTIDSVQRIKHKIPNFELSRIAEIAVNEHYRKGTPDNDGIYYFLYIDFRKMKIRGISLEDFKTSFSTYLYQNDTEVRNLMKEKDENGKKKYNTELKAHEKIIREKLYYITK
jgi:hypothetical protein